MNLKRYVRQSTFSKLGARGQQKLMEAKVAIVGIGALGTVIANNLARAGVGYLRLIDRDFVELHNLHRQILFTEQDVDDNLPKAEAAKKRLSAVNSEIEIEAIVADFNAFNAEELLFGMDLVMDGTDNRETRQLINEVSCKRSIPWIYGGALGSVGSTMNVLPGKTACYQCLIGDSETGTGESCSTMGVLNMITGIVASYESAEAVKILIGSENVRKELLVMDIWNNTVHSLPVHKRPDCPICAKGQYQRLQQTGGTGTTQLCGQNAVQVVPGVKREMDFAELERKLESIGEVTRNNFLLRFKNDEVDIKLFRDGRAIIQNIVDPNRAKSIYTEYFGL